MNLAFIVPLRHAGLALSIGLASCINAALLFRGLRQRQHYQPKAGWGMFGLKIGLALAALATTLWLGMGKESDWLAATALTRVIHLTALVSGGAAVYFATLWLLGFRLRDFHQRGAT
jgi:putative peptidoglycan lipid II flippase